MAPDGDETKKAEDEGVAGAFYSSANTTASAGSMSSLPRHDGHGQQSADPEKDSSSNPRSHPVLGRSPSDNPSETTAMPGGQAGGFSSPANGGGGDEENGGNSSGEPLEKAESAPEVKRTRLQTGLIVGSLCSAMFLAALDTTIITTAIPVIAAEFDSTIGYTWIGSAYLLGNSASVPSWGKFSDIWGRKPILLIAAGVFWIGSLVAGLANSMGMLIAARAVQGVGGGGVVVLVNICIGDLFSMRERGFYYGIMGMVWAVAGAVGPVLGGVFTSKATWRWCFYVNLPVAGLSMFILTLVLKLHNPRTRIREGLAAIDWIGSATIIGGTLMLLLGLQFGGVTFPWSSPTVVCLLVFGMVTTILFVLNEWKFAKFPVIPLRLFHERSNVAALCTCAMHGYVFISGSYYLPLYFQAVLGASSLMSGIYLLPYAISLAVSSSTTGMAVKKTGKYLPFIFGGMTVLTLGFGLFIDLPANANWPKIILYQLVAGVGVGPNFQSPLLALQNHVEPRDMASATAMYAFTRQLFTSISVVIGGVVFQNEMEKQQPFLQSELGPEVAGRMSGEEAAANVDFVGALEGEEGDIARAAYAKSISTMFIMYTAFAALGLLISFGVKGKQLSKQHKEHRTGLKGLNGQFKGENASESKEGVKVDEEKGQTTPTPAK